MSYKINGSAASIGAISVKWALKYQGIDHNGQPVASRFADVELRFPEEAQPADLRQWMNNCSTGSVTLTIPTQWGTSFTDLSAVYCEITQFPEIQDVHATQLVMIVRNAPVNL